jgi:hypothetical protein
VTSSPAHAAIVVHAALPPRSPRMLSERQRDETVHRSLLCAPGGHSWRRASPSVVFRSRRVRSPTGIKAEGSQHFDKNYAALSEIEDPRLPTAVSTLVETKSLRQSPGQRFRQYG